MNNIILNLLSNIKKGVRMIVTEGWGSFWRHYKYIRKVETQLKKHLKKTRKVSFDTILQGWHGEKMSFPVSSETPKVSIIIPAYNNAKYTFNCLKSILKYTEGAYEVIVVDDTSNDETSELLKNIENIQVVRNTENQGFVESCNRGAKLSRGKYLFFLNNDTLVTENWLEPLENVLSQKDVGAVGAKLIYPDGRLQEAGGIIWNDASGWNYGRGDAPDRPEYNFIREVDYCSGAALLIKKDLFEKLNGFDERFKPAYYEDTDLCFSIRKSGYKVLYQPDSIIIHFEGATAGTQIKTGVKRYQEINKAKFYDKWKDILEKEHYKPKSINLLFFARNKRKGKNILIIDHYIPTFDKDSGSYRMSNIIKILSELGHKVTLIGDNLLYLEPYTQIFQQYGVEVIYAPYIKSINKYLSQNGKFFDIVILSRLHVAIKHIFTVKKYCLQGKIIFDTVDLHHIREMRRATVENNKNILKRANKLKKIEFEVAKICDLTLVVTPVEKEILLKEDPTLKVDILTNIHELFPPEKTFSERKDIMFLGGFDHLPNIDAVKCFVKEILPLVKREIPDIKFYIIGSNPPEEVEKLSSDETQVIGFVKDLTPWFENCRILVTPLRYGAGMKGKIGEAMAHGLPVVTTLIGAEGMGLKDMEDVLIADSPEEFAQKTVMLYKNERLWNSLSKNSITYIQNNLSYNLIKKKISKLIERLL